VETVPSTRGHTTSTFRMMMMILVGGDAVAADDQII
jgi:hypothetical protein